MHTCTHQEKPKFTIHDLVGSRANNAGSFCCDVPEDVVIDILSRLPVKSILRFKSVCKSWHALIKSPGFFKNHQLQRSLMNRNNAPLFVTTYTREGRAHRSVSWISSSNNEAAALELEQVPYFNLASLPFSDRTPTPIDIHGPVNGVYCAISIDKSSSINVGKESMFLYNPALREFKAIPHVPHPLMHYFCGVIRYGFGYDSRSNDFKVVAVTRCPNRSWSWTSILEVSVLIYSLSSNSWREINSSNLPAFPGDQQPAVFFSHGNGLVHWVSLYGYEVLSFDLGTEMFKLLPLPVAITYDDATLAKNRIFNKICQVTVFDGSISLILESSPSYPTLNEEKYDYTIWTMKEYGVKDSWTKLYHIRLPLRVRPLSVSTNNGGDILFDMASQLVAYSARSQKIKDLHIRRPRLVVAYMESLVSINGG